MIKTTVLHCGAVSTTLPRDILQIRCIWCMVPVISYSFHIERMRRQYLPYQACFSRRKPAIISSSRRMTHQNAFQIRKPCFFPMIAFKFNSQRRAPRRMEAARATQLWFPDLCSLAPCLMLRCVPFLSHSRRSKLSVSVAPGIFSHKHKRGKWRAETDNLAHRVTMRFF